MKIFFLRLFLLGSMLLSGHALLAQRDMKAFEHGAIALDVGTTGIGLFRYTLRSPYEQV